jgi:hypothetical protein
VITQRARTSGRWLVPEAVHFFPPARGMRAPEVRCSPKFHSCECDFNERAIGLGWGASRWCRHLCITQWGGGGVTCGYVKSATL